MSHKVHFLSVVIHLCAYFPLCGSFCAFGLGFFFVLVGKKKKIFKDLYFLCISGMYVIHDFFQLWFYHTEVTCAVYGILKIQEVINHEQFLGHKRLSCKNNKKQKQ